MILYCSYEELTALDAGARLVLERVDEGAGVAAPPEVIAEIEHWRPQWTGDLTIHTLEEAQRLERVVTMIVEEFRDTLENRIIDEGVAGEGAVTAYFDFGYAYELLHRIRRMAAQMIAMIEVMTGRPPTPETARSVTFSD